MGKAFSDTLKGEGITVEQRHRGGPEDAEDSREFVEHYLVDQHKTTVKALNHIPADTLAELKQILDSENLEDDEDVRAGVSRLDEDQIIALADKLQAIFKE